MIFPIYGNIKTVPNHQPEYDIQSWHNSKILGVKQNETIGLRWGLSNKLVNGDIIYNKWVDDMLIAIRNPDVFQ